MGSSITNADHFVPCVLGRRSPNPLYDPIVWPKVVSSIDQLTESSAVKKPLVRIYQSAMEFHSYPKVSAKVEQVKNVEVRSVRHTLVVENLKKRISFNKANHQTPRLLKYSIYLDAH
jgi:hypothetical protein